VKKKSEQLIEQKEKRAPKEIPECAVFLIREKIFYKHSQ